MRYYVVRDGFGTAGQNATFRVVGPGCGETVPCITESCDYIAAGPFLHRQEAVDARNKLHRDRCDGTHWDGCSSHPCMHEAHA